MKIICVYCGSSDNIPSVHREAARQLGADLARRGITLVYGGGSTGLMGTVADSALQTGGEVWGVIPKIFATPRFTHQGLTRLEVSKDLHHQKARMIAISDGFIALPGGFGTLDELFEVLTWAQIGLHRKPIGLLNTGGYYNPFLNMVDQAASQGFIYPQHRQLFTYRDEPATLLDAMLAYQWPEGLGGWMAMDE
jgi:uncharacterized protein (TIGR00730 family)